MDDDADVCYWAYIQSRCHRNPGHFLPTVYSLKAGGESQAMASTRRHCQPDEVISLGRARRKQQPDHGSTPAIDHHSLPRPPTQNLLRTAALSASWPSGVRRSVQAAFTEVLFTKAFNPRPGIIVDGDSALSSRSDDKDRSPGEPRRSSTISTDAFEPQQIVSHIDRRVIFSCAAMQMGSLCAEAPPPAVRSRQVTAISRHSLRRHFANESAPIASYSLAQTIGLRSPSQSPYSPNAPNTAAVMRSANGGLDLILMPGLGFDQLGKRLGRGKGFYDTYLERCIRHPKGKPYTIALAFKEQLCQEIPVDDNDVLIDEVLYENDE
ncbi:5-formyltetrahydrofolate cyclo-ligase isoform X1 [Lates japonicus]|uniref:5-formyltetrahydrofolate cyclo-ligase n=1 Tax=Lates japonicus TaxID=270547 RepID=A0AAD3MM72_LATJO|nr:5-formyltetrahydrofolate cyclo-ligase isoform X1 [Lates japonicus]